MWEPGDIDCIIESYSTWKPSKHHTIFFIAPAVNKATQEVMSFQSIQSAYRTEIKP